MHSSSAGERAPRKIGEKVGRSVDQHVSAQTPPLLIVHAKDDAAVPFMNSEQLADAAARAKVPVRLLLIEKGGHGFGLGVHGGEAATWFDQFLRWLQGGASRGTQTTG